MSIMDMFRQAKAPEPLAASKQADEAKKAAEEAAKKTSEDNTNKKENESPLDKFSNVFKIDDKNNDEPPIFNIDPTKLTEQAAKTNFVNSLPPEVLAEMAKGGEEGVQAALKAINNVAQTSYAQSTLVAAKLVEHALEKQKAQFVDVVIPQIVRQMDVQGRLSESNPAFNHPAVAPVLSAVRDQLAKQHPDASPKELTSMAQEYVSAVANAVNPPKDPTQQENRKGRETDWSRFLES